VQLCIDDVFNLGEVDVQWSAKLVVTDQGIHLQVEVPDQTINLPTHNTESDSFNDWETTPIFLSNNSAVFFIAENDGLNDLHLNPTQAWVDWSKKSLTIQFDD
jgi:hypothetical protein